MVLLFFSKKGKGASSEKLSFLFPKKVKGKSPSFLSVHLSILSCFPYYSAKRKERERLKCNQFSQIKVILSEDTVVHKKNLRFS